MSINPLEVGEKSRSFLSSSGDIKVPNETYRIFGFWLTYILTIILVGISVSFIVVGVIEITKGHFSIHYILVPIALMIIACIITYFFPFYSSITVDLTNKEVTCRKYQLFFIIRKIVKIETTNIARVYCEKNLNEGFGNNDENSVDGFNLVFEMKNGEKIIGLEGEIDKNYEMMKVGFFMSKFFPSLADSNQSVIPISEEKQ